MKFINSKIKAWQRIIAGMKQILDAYRMIRIADDIREEEYELQPPKSLSSGMISYLPISSVVKDEFRRKHKASYKTAEDTYDYLVRIEYGEAQEVNHGSSATEYLYITPKGHGLVDGAFGIPFGLISAQFDQYGKPVIAICSFIIGSVVTTIVALVKNLL